MRKASARVLEDVDVHGSLTLLCLRRDPRDPELTRNIVTALKRHTRFCWASAEYVVSNERVDWFLERIRDLEERQGIECSTIRDTVSSVSLWPVQSVFLSLSAADAEDALIEAAQSCGATTEDVVELCTIVQPSDTALASDLLGAANRYRLAVQMTALRERGLAYDIVLFLRTVQATMRTNLAQEPNHIEKFYESLSDEGEDQDITTSAFHRTYLRGKGLRAIDLGAIHFKDTPPILPAGSFIPRDELARIPLSNRSVN